METENSGPRLESHPSENSQRATPNNIVVEPNVANNATASNSGANANNSNANDTNNSANAIGSNANDTNGSANANNGGANTNNSGANATNIGANRNSVNNNNNSSSVEGGEASGINSSDYNQIARLHSYIAAASIVRPAPSPLGVQRPKPGVLTPGALSSGAETPGSLFGAGATPPTPATPAATMSAVNSRRTTSSSSASSSSLSSSEDEDEFDRKILEESPCRRWQKRKEKVMQNDIPGSDASFLAMDTEEGFEVVWSEMLFSERKKFKDQQEKIASVFDHLIQLDHPNIMKFHKYWMDSENTDQPRVVFIKEYMSSGSLAHFLRKTRMNRKRLQLKSWKRWCTEILSALTYLHSRWSGDRSIVHGNLSCDTVFIQQNGTIKIGSVSLEAINHHVKTCREPIDRRYFAPELVTGDEGGRRHVGTGVDVYAFGVVALVMATALTWPAGAWSAGGRSQPSTDEENADVAEPEMASLEASLGNDLGAAIDKLDNSLQRDFLRQCLDPDRHQRAAAKDLLNHPILSEGVTTLAVSAASVLLRGNRSDWGRWGHVIQHRLSLNDAVVAVSPLFPDGVTIVDVNGAGSIAGSIDALRSFADELVSGSYAPLRPFTRPSRGAVSASSTPAGPVAGVPASAAVSSAASAGSDVAADVESLVVGSVDSLGGAGVVGAGVPEEFHGAAAAGGGAEVVEGGYQPERRKILQMSCSLKPLEDEEEKGESMWALTLLLRLSDKMNRQLTAVIGSEIDTAVLLVDELIHFAFIAAEDGDRVVEFLSRNLARIAAPAGRHSSVDEAPGESG